jgi:hypothetical protein
MPSNKTTNRSLRRGFVQDQYTTKEVYRNEKNVSTEKTSQKNGTRLPQKNGNEKRPQGSFPQTREGQKKTDLLIRRCISFCVEG